MARNRQLWGKTQKGPKMDVFSGFGAQKDEIRLNKPGHTRKILKQRIEKYLLTLRTIFAIMGIMFSGTIPEQNPCVL